MAETRQAQKSSDRLSAASGGVGYEITHPSDYRTSGRYRLNNSLPLASDRRRAGPRRRKRRRRSTADERRGRPADPGAARRKGRPYTGGSEDQLGPPHRDEAASRPADGLLDGGV